MKKFAIFLFMAAAFAALSACSEEEADIQGRVGNYVYIVGGTEADYQSTTCEVFHTPDLEDGSVQMAVTVGLTSATDVATTVTIDVDNSSVSDSYSVVPDGVLSYSSTVTIPAGETSATINVNVAQSSFPQLTEPQYEVVFRIVDVTGDVNISTNSNAAILYIIAETIDPADNLIYTDESVNEYTLKCYDDGKDGDTVSKTITITGSEEAYKSFDITLAVDNSLVDAYNAANGTSYIALSNTSIVNLTTATMETGETSTTATISISDSDRDTYLTEEGGYLIPVVISDVGTATLSDGCGVTYLIVNVQYIEGSMDYFSALYLGDYRLSTWAMFSKPVDLTVDDGYTYVFHIFIDEVTRVSRIGDFADANEDWINMLRFGQKGDYDTRLEWYVGPNGCRQNLYTSALEAQKWYQIGLVYSVDDGDYGAYFLYVEGELQDYYYLTESDYNTMQGLTKPSFQALEFNSSWGENYRDGNEFHGRLWRVAVFNWALPKTWIYDYGYCYHTMHPSILANPVYYGLSAYWTMDEGYGYVCHESTGTYEDIDFSNTTRCDDESTMVSADVSEYVQWKTDSYNKFD